MVTINRGPKYVICGEGDCKGEMSESVYNDLNNTDVYDENNSDGKCKDKSQWATCWYNGDKSWAYGKYKDQNPTIWGGRTIGEGKCKNKNNYWPYQHLFQYNKWPDTNDYWTICKRDEPKRDDVDCCANAETDSPARQKECRGGLNTDSQECKNIINNHCKQGYNLTKGHCKTHCLDGNRYEKCKDSILEYCGNKNNSVNSVCKKIKSDLQSKIISGTTLPEHENEILNKIVEANMEKWGGDPDAIISGDALTFCSKKKRGDVHRTQCDNWAKAYCDRPGELTPYKKTFCACIKGYDNLSPPLQAKCDGPLCAAGYKTITEHEFDCPPCKQVMATIGAGVSIDNKQVQYCPGATPSTPSSPSTTQPSTQSSPKSPPPPKKTGVLYYKELLKTYNINTDIDDINNPISQIIYGTIMFLLLIIFTVIMLVSDGDDYPQQYYQQQQYYPQQQQYYPQY